MLKMYVSCEKRANCKATVISISISLAQKLKNWNTLAWVFKAKTKLTL